MKANRKAILNDEEAVSPVIAVILMVAITVVLAATVFVLVNELGQDVGSTGPTLGLSTQNSATNSDQWSVTVNSATRAADIDEYTFILTVDGTTKSSQWRTDAGEAHADGGKPTNGSDGAYFEHGDSDELCYQLTHNDIGSDGDLRVGDRLVLKMIDTTGGTATGCDSELITANSDFADDMSDEHTLEFIHRPSESGAGSISRNF